MVWQVVTDGVGTVGAGQVEEVAATSLVLELLGVTVAVVEMVVVVGWTTINSRVSIYCLLFCCTVISWPCHICVYIYTAHAFFRSLQPLSPPLQTQGNGTDVRVGAPVLV